MKRKQLTFKAAKQAGFTLIELALVVGILGILYFSLKPDEDPNKAKAVSMMRSADTVGDGAKRLRLDAGCHPTRPDALFVRASAATSLCGISLVPKWKGPYISSSPATAAGNLKVEANVAAGAELALTSAAGGAGTQYFVRFTGVPNAVINRALESCNGNTTDAGRCVGTVGVGGTGTFDVMYDETL